MTRIARLLFVFFLATGCSGGDSSPAALTTEQKAAIASYANNLLRTFNSHDHSLVNDSWNHQAFKNRVSGLSKTEASLFAYIFEKQVKNDIRYTNLLIINEISKQGATAWLTRIQHFNTHSEITFSIIFPDGYTFTRYRVEMIGDKPYISDMYDFKDGTWYSESIKNFLLLNARYDGLSAERRAAYGAMNLSNQLLKKGDTLGALEALYEIPPSHWVGNGLSIKRLELAANLNDTLYADVLDTEFSYNQSLYLQYIYYLGIEDDAALFKVLETLKNETGITDQLDSLVRTDAVWF